MGFVVLAFEWYIVTIAADQDQIAIVQINRIDNLLIKRHTQCIIFQLGITQLHKHFMLGTVCYLRCAEGNIDQIFADRTGECPFHQSEISLGLVFRHNTGGLAILCDDLFLIIDKAAVNRRHITAVTANAAANLANFFFSHRNTSFH